MGTLVMINLGIKKSEILAFQVINLIFDREFEEGVGTEGVNS